MATVTSTWAFYDSFEAKDVRRTKLLTSYMSSTGEQIDRNTPQSKLAMGPIALKMGYDPRVSASGGHSDIDLILYRYADVYFVFGRSIVAKNRCISADLAKAVSLINVVRQRAGSINYLQATSIHPKRCSMHC